MSSHPVYRCVLTGSHFSQGQASLCPLVKEAGPGGCQDRHPQLAAPHFWSSSECIHNGRFCFLSNHFCRAALVAPGTHLGFEPSSNDQVQAISHTQPLITSELLRVQSLDTRYTLIYPCFSEE